MTDAVLERLPRVFRLEPQVFAEVGEDERATGAALAVALGAAVLEGLGQSGAGLEGVLTGLAGSALRWGLWVGAIHLLAGLLGLGSELGHTFRALGFAAAPFALGVLESVPVVGGIAWLAKWGLGGAAFIVATRRTFGTETLTAAGLCAVGLLIASILSYLVL